MSEFMANHILPCSSSKPPGLKEQYSIKDGHCRRPTEQLIDKGFQQQGQWLWKGNKRMSSSASRWDQFQKSA